MKGQKKSKKTFSDGLEEILHHTLFEDNLHDKPSMFELVQQPIILHPPANIITVDVSKTIKPKKSKSFSENLEDFFKESLDEGFDSSIVSIKRNISRKDERPTIGIDVLLQKTLIDDEQTPAHLQRVTFVLDTPRMEQLKTIARQEQKPLNAVLLELVELYIANRPTIQEKTTPTAKIKPIKVKKVVK
jgi:hypothetical protein